VGTGVAEHAAWRLADRRAYGGDDVGVLDLLAHGCASFHHSGLTGNFNSSFQRRLESSVFCARFNMDPGSTHIPVLSRMSTSCAQLRSGLPVFIVCAMRSCVFGICARDTKCLRSSSSSQSSSTSLPRSIWPPQSVSA